MADRQALRDLQARLADRLRATKTEERKLTQQKEAQAIDGLRRSMTVNEVSEAEMARWRQKVQPVVEKFSREIGESVVGEVNAELSRMRAAK